MTSKAKDNIFRPSASWLSRAGVVVGYCPEDTMKSMIREELHHTTTNNNQESHQLEEDKRRPLQFEETLRPSQLAGMVRPPTLNDAAYRYSGPDAEGQGEEDSEREEELDGGSSCEESYGMSYDEEDEEEGTPSTVISTRHVKFNLPQGSESSQDMSIPKRSQGSIESSKEINRRFDQTKAVSPPSSSSLAKRLQEAGPVPAASASDSGCDDERGEDERDDGAVEENEDDALLVDTVDDRMCVGETRTFEQILEEQLKLEEAKNGNKLSTSKNSANKIPATNNTNPSAPAKTKKGGKVPFLRKNQGSASWNASRRLAGMATATANQKSASAAAGQSKLTSAGSTRGGGPGVRKLESVTSPAATGGGNSTWTAQKSTHFASGGGHSNTKLSTIMAGGGQQTNNKVSQTLLYPPLPTPQQSSGGAGSRLASTTKPRISAGGGQAQKTSPVKPVTAPPQQSSSLPLLSHSLSKEEIEEQNAAEELEEFELLEQVADTSFASSISTVARLDKTSLKERLHNNQQQHRIRGVGVAKEMVPSSAGAGGFNGGFHFPESGRFRTHVLDDVRDDVEGEEEEQATLSNDEEDEETNDSRFHQDQHQMAGSGGINSRYGKSPMTTPTRPGSGGGMRPRKVAPLAYRSPTSAPVAMESTGGGGRFNDDTRWDEERGTVSAGGRHGDERFDEEDEHYALMSRQEDGSGFTDTHSYYQTFNGGMNHQQPPVQQRFNSCYQQAPQIQKYPPSSVPGNRPDISDALSPRGVLREENDVFNRAADLFPRVQVDKNKAKPEENSTIQAVNLRKWVDVLEGEIKRFNNENATLAALKKEREEAMKRMESEMKAFEDMKERSLQEFEEYKDSEMKKLRKEKKVFEDYQRAMKAMPNKKDREEIEALREELEGAREELSHKDSRWQAANSRLRSRVDQLEAEKEEMQGRLRVLEQRRLDLQSQLAAAEQKLKHQEGQQQQKRPSLNSISQAVSFKRAPTVVGGGVGGSSTGRSTSTASITNAIGRQRGPPSQQLPQPLVEQHPYSGQYQQASDLDSMLPGGGVNGLRGSTASGYYTGEEEASSSGSHAAHNRMSKDDFEMTTAQLATIKKYSTENKGQLKEEIKHPDNILEKIYASGALEIFYPNGSIKEVSPDGETTVVSLFNGDVKQILPDGRVVYFYAEEKTIQTTHSDGVEEIQYSDGRKEVTRPTGVRELYFPDQTVKYVYPGGREESVHANGMVVRTLESGDKEILLPNGQKEVHSGGVKRRVYPDGTTKTVFADGRQETRYASGRVRIKDKQGNLIVDTRV